MTIPTTCAICGIKATQLCGSCKSVVYCGRDHQKEHWKKGHKKQCKCYEISTNAVLGRHIRATRDIKIGEIIMREQPLVVGPKVASVPLCLGCHRNLLPPQAPTKNYYKCSKCTWPLCSADCELTAQHADECALMANSNFQSKINFNTENGGTSKKESAYCVILLLRCMQLKHTNPEAFARLYELEDHLQERLETPLYQILRANLITFIKTVLGLKEWPELEILRIAAILDTNTFEVRQPSERRKIRALYPGAAMMSHDCVPNIRHTFDEQMNIIFLAKRKIAKGEIICISYTQPLRSTLQRRLHLRQTKCFDCTCARCTDESELGTFAGAITCTKCKVGKIVSTNPLNNAANWKCQICNQRKTALEIHKLDTQLQQELEALDKSTPMALEEFIYNHRVILHETNTHVLQAKYALTQIYGNMTNYELHALPDEALKRKIELCEELLKLADLYDGGWSIFRGNLLLDLEEALVEQTLRAKEDANIQEEKLKRADEILNEVVKIMQLQPEMTEILNERKATLENELAKFIPAEQLIN